MTVSYTFAELLNKKRLQKYNDVHDPKTGKFAPKNGGAVGNAGAGYDLRDPKQRYKSIVNECKDIIDNTDYEFYGIRTQTKSFGDKPGDVMQHYSSDWEDGKIVNRESLNGPCAIDIDSIDEMSKGGYEGKTIILLGSDIAMGGNDPAEIIMSDPVVLARYSWDRKTGKLIQRDKIKSNPKADTKPAQPAQPKIDTSGHSKKISEYQSAMDQLTQKYKAKYPGIPEGMIFGEMSVQDKKVFREARENKKRLELELENQKNLEKSDRINGCGVLVINDGKILTGTRIDGKHRNQICGPGGHIEAGETPEDAAAREAYEEFGIECQELEPLGILDGGRNYGKSAVFLCTDYDGKPQTDEEEMTDIQWRTIDELREERLFWPFEQSLSLLEE